MTIKTILSKSGKNLSYVHHQGKGPGVIFMGGYASDMEGSKALHLEQICLEKGLQFTRFDYSGHGKSEGKFEDGTLEEWFHDALTIFDEATTGPQIIIGSSMGGWIMLNVLKHRATRIHAMIGIAAAPDFTTFLWPNLTEAQRQTVINEGVLIIPPESAEGNPTILSKKFMDNAPSMYVMNAPLACSVPLHLIHSMQDIDVPHRVSLDILNHLKGDLITLTLLKDGDHRLSRPQDLILLTKILETFI